MGIGNSESAKINNREWLFEIAAFLIYGLLLLVVVVGGIELCSLLFLPRLAPTEQYEKQIMREERSQIGTKLGKIAFDHLKEKYEQ